MLNWFAARTFRSSFCGQANDKFVARLRGFGPIGILAILLILGNFIIASLSAILVLVWTKFQVRRGARLVMCDRAAGPKQLGPELRLASP